jgi:hypothetical protein
LKDEKKRKEKDAGETEDIYDAEQREEMLKDDEITEAEYSFMAGREKAGKRKGKKGLGLERKGHDDTASVELAEEEYEED